VNDIYSLEFGSALRHARSVLTAPNDVHSEKFAVLFWSFLQK